MASSDNTEMEKSSDKYGRGKKDEYAEGEDPDKDIPDSEWFTEMVHQLQLKEKQLKTQPEIKKVLDELTIEAVCRFIKSGECKNIITMAGAGISTAAGIPDFRSPESGLYAKLMKDPAFAQQLPAHNPHAIFDIGFFKINPKPFYLLAKELYPDTDKFKPTKSHYFIRLLQDKGLLLRHYTQNIDTLERSAGVKDEKLVEAHGSFNTLHCLKCRASYTPHEDYIRDTVMNKEVPKCTKMDASQKKCDGLIKPDITFFGEALDENYFKMSMQDFPKCDLLIVMGTSLVVQPFAVLPERVPLETPRLYINRTEPLGGDDPVAVLLAMDHGFRFEDKQDEDDDDNPITLKAYRDVFFKGDTDDACLKMAELLGWKADLERLANPSSRM